MIQTDLDQQRADQSAQTQAQSITPINIGSPTIDASGWQQFFDKWQGYSRGIPKVKAPSESDIRDGMWESSFVVALLAGLATGNAAAGITGGLWAAIAVHDEGYARRDRAQYVTQLYSQGISAPAIMQWYETGDTKILEQEKDRIQREADHKDELQQRGLDRAQQKTFHADEMTNARLARQQQAGFHADEVRHEGIMEGIAQQNAASARIAAVAKMGEQAGQQMASQASTGGGQPHLQTASFDASTVAVPQGITDPTERAAFINGAAQAYHGQMIKDAIQSTSDLKQLGQRMSPQTQMYDKVKEAASKGWNAPANAAGDTQLLMAYQTAETPNKSASTTQITPLMKEMTTGTLDSVENWILRQTGNGLTASDRATAKTLLKQNAQNQIEAHMDNLKSTLDTDHYDLSDPRTMAALVNAFHVKPDTIRALASGSETPETAAKKETDALLPEKKNFAQVQKSTNQNVMEGNW